MLLGVDTGGTFTDFVLYASGEIRVHKVLSTPDAPERAILQGISELRVPLDHLVIIHGSTVATNAVLEGKGVRTAYIANRGLKDVIRIGRQARPALYDLAPETIRQPFEEDLLLETGGRLAADGSVLEPLTTKDLGDLQARVVALGVEAVAVNLLFSYLDPSFEQAIAAAMPDTVFVSCSSEVLPEYREYERGMAAWLNAWIGPRVQGYLQRLQQQVKPARLAIMQSSGGTMSADFAGRFAVNMLLSGPAGGLMAARFLGEQTGRRQLLTFDMGGTSTDVALVDGDIRLTNEGRIADFPVAVPMVDMHTIGAGGGSIAYLDAGGLLQVGPESSGADPGPACYGRGGEHPTVTDANLVLGRLLAGAFLGGHMTLQAEAAYRVISELAVRMGCSPEQAAEGIIRIANEHMAHALRVISVQRGIDPRDFTLLSFGGAGGLHVCALAEALQMRKAMVPVHCGVFSALGMLVTAPSRQLSRTLSKPLRKCGLQDLQAEFARLLQLGREALLAEGCDEKRISFRNSVDLRYTGQSYYLNVQWPDTQDAMDVCERDFHLLHEQTYGHALASEVELVNVRVSVRGPGSTVQLQTRTPGKTAGVSETRLHGISQPVPILPREALQPDHAVFGPALITETTATTYLAPGWRAETDGTGSLWLERT
jgi:N-methylhydantoinase A